MAKGKLYIGRFLEKTKNDDPYYYYSYRVGRSQNIDLTIEEYGTNKKWSFAQQVILFGKSQELVLKNELLRWSMGYDECKETIYYDAPFPTMTMEEAIGIISQE